MKDGLPVTYISFYLRSNTARVFIGALRAIGEPGIIHFLINEERMELIMEPYHKKDFQSFRVPADIYTDAGKTKNMTVHSKAFCRLLAMRLGWDITESYRVPGVIFHQQNMIVFRLTSAQII